MPITHESQIEDVHARVRGDKRIRFIEYRVDLWDSRDRLQYAVEESPVQAIVTNRREAEGGKFEGDETALTDALCTI